jgi:hypothetical protein
LSTAPLFGWGERSDWGLEGILFVEKGKPENSTGWDNREFREKEVDTVEVVC